jgi:hypothetical protein
MVGAHILQVIEKNSDTSYDQELRERLLAVRSRQEEFVRRALEHGISEEELPAVVADAMTAKELPAIIEGMSFRGSGFSVMFLDGEIPHDYLSVKPLYEGDKYTGARIFVTRSPQAEENFTLEKSPTLPQTNDGQPIDTEVLQKFDSYLTSRSSET